MSTLTLTQIQTRPRRFSLSLVSARLPPLLDLPAELVLDILELALKGSKPSTLSVVSKAVSNFVDIILYRNVILRTKEAITLFHRTTLSKSPAFFASHVKKLVVTYVPRFHSLQSQRLSEIVPLCTGLRALVLPSGLGMECFALCDRLPGDGSLQELSFQSHDGLDLPSCYGARKYGAQRVSSVTHLRVCEPGETGWMSPSHILSSFGTLPQLTHLQLSRSINANEENDAIFIEDIKSILRDRPSMKMLVVTVFPQSWAPSQDVTQSSIWEMLSALAKGESRLVVRNGEFGDWVKDCEAGRLSVVSQRDSFWKMS